MALLKRYAFLVLSFEILVSAIAGAEPARIAILGDSITYAGHWVVKVESALRATPNFAEAEIVNFGLASETVSGLSEPGHAGGAFPRPCVHERLGRVLAEYKPTHVLACYGMNDGIYQPNDDARFDAFCKGAEKLKTDVEKIGARLVFITPPLFKADKPEQDTMRYDEVLNRYASWLNDRSKTGWQVIDIRPQLRKAIEDEKKSNPAFVYSKDGIHPEIAGHHFMAIAIHSGLWKLWKLSGSPEIAADPALDILRKRNELLKHAWLSKTKHLRPGVPAGLPLDQANEQAAKLLIEYRAASLPKVSQWKGFEQLKFTFNSRPALLVKPKTPARGNPWIWRTEFFGHEPQGDIALLEKGFHVAYIDMQNLYGAPASMKIMDEFFIHLTSKHALSSKTVLEGFSRGGLYAFNWAAHRPTNVAGLYVDAPVCDFKSWPGGKGSGPGSPGDWQRLLKAYQFTEEQALAYDKNPVDNLAPLAKARIPIFAIIGDADEVVPVSENIDLIEKRYKALGGKIAIIRKPGGKHHPHSLPNPQPIVDFAMSAVGLANAQPAR